MEVGIEETEEEAHRRPNPKTDMMSSSERLPSGVMNRSGRNVSGSGYISGSCSIALRTSNQY